VHVSHESPIDGFLAAVVAGSVAGCDVWSHDVVLDATVPDWRFRKDGVRAVKDEYARWFADPGRFEELRRVEFAGGEVVAYLLTWLEGGVTHAARHLHILDVQDGRITRDTVVCGGRWPAPLVERMRMAQALEDSGG
jgi:hypothetical protein